MLNTGSNRATNAGAPIEGLIMIAKTVFVTHG